MTLGNAMQLASVMIEPESVDLILCDPVWWELEQYLWLGKTAMRVLKPGGNVVAQMGSEFRYEAETLLRMSGLTPRPMLVENFSGGYMQMWKHRSLNTYHPYAWLSKGAEITRDRWMHNGVRGSVDKSRHDWGDGTHAFIRWIEALTEPGDVVLDPFAGSGTVAVSCIVTGRNYAAFEINPETYDKTLERLRTTQRPLAVPNLTRQLDMELVAVDSTEEE